MMMTMMMTIAMMTTMMMMMMMMMDHHSTRFLTEARATGIRLGLATYSTTFDQKVHELRQ